MAIRIKTTGGLYLSGFLKEELPVEKPRYRWTKSRKNSIRYGSYSEAKTIMDGIQCQYDPDKLSVLLERE